MDETNETDSDPPWLVHALRNMGCKELVSDSLNPAVRAFFAFTSFPPSLVNRKTAWCSAFACAMIEKAGYRSPHSAAAKSFLVWGKELIKPRRGAVLVFTRGAANADTGHVGFYVSETTSEFLVLGGNQGNCVSVQRYDKARLLAIRWPTERLKPTKARAPSGSPAA